MILICHNKLGSNKSWDCTLSILHNLKHFITEACGNKLCLRTQELGQCKYLEVNLCICKLATALKVMSCSFQSIQVGASKVSIFVV